MSHIYCKQGAEVTVSSRFLYLEEIYLSSNNQWALYRSQKYKSKVPIKCENTIRYSKKHSCCIHRYWELLSAPEEFLIKNGFKPKL